MPRRPPLMNLRANVTAAAAAVELRRHREQPLRRQMTDDDLELLEELACARARDSFAASEGPDFRLM
jgi:hypothetical protein